MLKNKQLIIRRLGLMMCDALSVVVATFLALIARFDFSVAQIPEQVYINTAKDFLPYSIVITLVLFWLFHLYQSLWEYAGAPEMFSILGACFCSAVIQMLIVNLILHWIYPRSCYVFFGGFLLALVAITRFFYRAFRTFIEKRVSNAKSVNVMIIGAGDAGNTLIREMRSSSYIEKNAMTIRQR